MQNNTNTGSDGRNTAPAAGEMNERMHEAMESMGRIRRRAVAQRIHDLQISTEGRAPREDR